MRKITAAAICMNSTEDTTANLLKAHKLVGDAINHGAHWILLPELFPYMGPYDNLAELSWKQESLQWMPFQDLARKSDVQLFMGSVPDLNESHGSIKKPYNTAYWVDGSGTLRRLYRKTHLFTLRNDAGVATHSEADGFSAGNVFCFFEVEGWKVCYCICYDLRFAGLFESVIAQHGPFDVLMVPAAFTDKTGKAHWELLLRARAVEYQCYVIAANQTGKHVSAKALQEISESNSPAPIKTSFGHSMIVNPWGEVLANTREQEGFATAELDPEFLASVRHRLPALQNRRKDLYT